MRPPSSRALLVALIVGTPACRGCLVDGVTYEGAGGGATTSAGPSTTTDATGSSDAASSGEGSSTGVGGDATSSSVTTSAGGGGAASSAGSAGGGGDGAGGGTSTGAGGQGGCPTSDDFDEGLGECWDVLEEGDAVATFADGVVTLVPDDGTGWYDANDSAFYFQEVTGDFSASIRVDAVVTGGSYQLAGLLLRDPGPAPEEWIKSEVGFVAFASTTLYVGATVASDTEILYSVSDDVTASNLGVCRRGDLVIMAGQQRGPWFLYGGSLDPAASEDVPDLPATIQIGFEAGAEVGGAHLTATFDDFRISLGGQEDCLDALEALSP